VIEEAELLDARPQTTVSYSRTFNLGNYENEKLFISLLVEDNETPQQAMIRARAMVDEMHSQFQVERDRAEEISDLRRRIDAYSRGIKQYKERFSQAGQSLPVIERTESVLDDSDELAILKATAEALLTENRELEKAYYAYLRSWNSRVKAEQDDDDDEDYEEDEEDDDL
jgi:hypothetical protein